MSKVRLEFLSWLANTFGIEGTSEEIILEAKIEGDNKVRDLLNQLASRYPRFEQIVFDTKTQKLTEGVNVFLNNHLLELMNGLETKLNDGDILTLVPPIEGG
ncbi:MAG: MoaD/ThiS family protein [Chloroflexi bacterium]|nr:MoaD/ThiS family protein [Chloroflexota bacterium]